MKDSSGNGNDGVVHGAKWVDGKYGKALYFDGVDDYVKIPDDENLKFGTGDFSYSLWFNPSLKDVPKTNSIS